MFGKYIHKTPFECPDHLILFDDKHNDYGLMVPYGVPSLFKCLFVHGVVKNYKITIYNNFGMA
ncbi:DUF6980 family protein [Priestia aryabhattai]|uniref:DUF6980 family protein n=1 Tax=Priestia aryabhattai TaxID=412384 RepID=UPI003CC7A65A